MFPHGLHVDRDGNVWVTDAQGSKDGTKGHQVIKLSPDGKILMRLGTAGVAGGGPDHFTEPSDVVTAPNGDIFVADGHAGQNPTTPPDYVTRVVQILQGRQIHQAMGQARLRPRRVQERACARASIREVGCMVADRGNARIQIFDLEGKFLEEWKQFGRPSGLFIDKDDRLYAIDADSSAANNPG